MGKALARLRRHVDRPDGLIDGQDGEQALLGVIVDGVRSLVVQGWSGLADDDPRVVQLGADLDEVATRSSSQLARLEAAFVLLARHVEPALLPGALGTLVDALLPNELERRAADGERARGVALRLEPDGSGWHGCVDLDLECGELLHTVLEAEMATDPDNPRDTEQYAQLRADGWQPGDELPAAGGPRSTCQQRHDALESGLRRLLDSGALGLRDKVAPHVAVTIGLEALHGAPGALPGVTASGARVPLSLARRWCRGPGERLFPHHPGAWAKTGTTSVHDTVMVCEQTHHDLHSGGSDDQVEGRPVAVGCRVGRGSRLVGAGRAVAGTGR